MAKLCATLKYSKLGGEKQMTKEAVIQAISA
jgi:hypothetical protein